MRSRESFRYHRHRKTGHSKSGLRRWLLSLIAGMLTTSRMTYELATFILEALGRDALHGLAPDIRRIQKGKGELGGDTSPLTTDRIHSSAMDLLMGPSSESAQMQRALVRVLRLESRSALPVPSEVIKAFREFGRNLDLTPVALKVLRFYFVKASFEPMASYADRFSFGHDLFTLVASAVRVDVNDVRSILRSDSPLIELEILTLRHSPPHSLDLEETFFLTLTGARSTNSANKYFAKSSARRVFPLSSFPLPRLQIDILVGLLRGPEPVQILLAGRQGTGKSEIARSLCKAVNRTAFHVSLAPDGLESHRRIALRAAINQAKKGNAIVVMDEADDFLNVIQFSLFGPSKDRHSKAYINDLIDNSPVTIVWITNRIDGIDRSTMRRFGYFVWFRAFNRVARLSLWRRALKGHPMQGYVTPAVLGRLAAKYRVDAAGIANALDLTASVVRKRREIDSDTALSILQEFLSRHFNLISGSTASLFERDTPSFDPSLANVHGGSVDEIAETVDSYLSQQTEKRHGLFMLIVGPSAVGKSSLIQFLADRAECDVIRIRAIDLIRDREEGHVGLAFAEAEASGAILVVDDIEAAFPSTPDRNPPLYLAARSEFAGCIKAFRGILFATSTMPEQIDPFISSHFDITYKIGLPESIHLVGLAKHYIPNCATGDTAQGTIHERIASLAGLTHADFAMARRRLKSLRRKDIPIEDLFRPSTIRPDRTRDAVL